MIFIGKVRHGALGLFGWLAMMASVAAAEPPAQPLYPGDIPGAIVAPDEESVRDPKDPWPFFLDTSRPTITAYRPTQQDPKRAAVVILPGGGYRGTSMLKEGYDVARAFNDMGVTAFVVKYRTPSDKHMKNKRVGPLQDAQQAIATVRRDAAKWQIDPKRIGLIGFSAGGHLAATTGTMFDTPVLSQWRSADVRPDFLMLIYPVITFTEPTLHQGSRNQLLGTAPSPDDVKRFSAELAVTRDTPPTFLIHAADDQTVPVANSILFFQALQAQKIPAELMIYPAGGHGFGLNNATTGDRWIERCRQWLQSQGWIS
ncbi:alpha/beta hydrolase [Peristeroidobacter soli]|uniref:alpha/beta hydrolase n=1 Tax=Peristeroidobacter soli TaxID=2497877 RepID=UPI001C37C838|nr:alpha/beta hydrolase [Peristeroidobacter soli]